MKDERSIVQATHTETSHPKIEIERIFRQVDVNHSNVVNYTEFLAAAIETQGIIEEYRYAEAFDQMDIDDTGYISRENLRHMLGKNSSEELIDRLMEEADLKKDGRISYEEFLEVLNSSHRQSVAKMYDASEQMSIISDDEEASKTRAAEEVLRKHGIIGTLKSSMKHIGSIGHIKIVE